MSLQLDTSRALRTHDQLVSLVRAVLAASDDDESRAIEWKTGYADLTGTIGSFAIARAILGMANRSVSVAHAAFEGVGYLLVGVEPSKLDGQVVPDSAELLNAVRRFTGHGWPLWDPRSVAVDDKNVLVITVEPPRAGDRIALLHKSHQPAKGPLVPDGTVFVRQPGATERASRADMEMLQERIVDGAVAREETTRTLEGQREIRTLVAESVHAANTWADAMQMLVLSTMKDQWSERDWNEWVDTDSGRAMATNRQRVDQNARQLRLLTNDDALVGPLGVAQDVINVGSTWDALRGPSTSESRRAAYQQLDRVRVAFKNLEESAAELLSMPTVGLPR